MRRPIPFPARPPLQQEDGIDWPVELERAPYRMPGRKQLLDQTDTGNIGRSVQVPTVQTVTGPIDPATGMALQIPVATASDSAVPIIGVDCDDEEAKVVTITVSVAPPLSLPGLANVGLRQVQIVVQWGIGGARTEAAMDAIHGTSFSVLCSSLRVRARNLAPVVPGTNPSVNVAAFVGYWPKPFGPGPQLTLQGSTSPFPLTPGNSETVIIPAYATKLEFMRAASGLSYLVEYLRADGVDVVASFASAVDLVELPIPGDAAAVRLTNTDALNIKDRRYIFRLAL